MRHEYVIERMSQAVEAYRADYLRIKQAGNKVTAGELAAAIGAYKESLENLRVPALGKQRTRASL